MGLRTLASIALAGAMLTAGGCEPRGYVYVPPHGSGSAPSATGDGSLPGSAPPAPEVSNRLTDAVKTLAGLADVDALVRGTTVDARTGELLAGATVGVSSYGDALGSARSNASGLFALDVSHSPARLELKASYPGGLEATAVVWPANGVHDVRFALYPGGAEAVPGAGRLSLWPNPVVAETFSELPLSIVTAEPSDLLPTVVVRGGSDGIGPVAADGSFLAFRPGQGVVEAYHGTDRASAMVLAEAQGFLGSARGTVVDGEQQPVGGATVIASLQDDAAEQPRADYRVRSDSAGLYTFPHLPPGIYALTALSPEGGATAGYTTAQVVAGEVSAVSPLAVALPSQNSNVAPVIDALVSPPETGAGDPLPLECIAFDANDEVLTYTWEATDEGLFADPLYPELGVWVPGWGGEAQVTCTVSDDAGGSATATVDLTVGTASLRSRQSARVARQ